MKKLLVVFAIALLSGTSAFAGPTVLVTSTPAEGSVSDSAPTSFVLEFSNSVSLNAAYLKKDDDKEKALHGGGHSDSKTVTISAPALAPGHYTLEWSVFVPQSRVLSGRIRFTVSAANGTAPPAN